MNLSKINYFFVLCILSVILCPNNILATESIEEKSAAETAVVPDSSINDINKISGNSAGETQKGGIASATSTETSSSSTNTTKEAKISADDLEKSHSELTESKVEISKDGTSKDESLGTANSFPIGFTNKIPFDPNFISGAFSPQQNQFLPGDVGQYLGYPGSGAYPVADLSNSQYYSQLSQPFAAKDYSLGGIPYEGHPNPLLFGAVGSSGITGQPIYTNKPEFHQHGGIQKSLHSGYPNAYYGGIGQSGYGSYGYDGINPYGNSGVIGFQKSLLANQYPVTLSGGFQQPYSNPGYGLNPYQQFGGYGHQKNAGAGYQNPLAYQAALSKIRHQANPYYKQYDPIYSQPGGNKLYQRKSPYGFYTTDA